MSDCNCGACQLSKQIQATIKQSGLPNTDVLAALTDINAEALASFDDNTLDRMAQAFISNIQREVVARKRKAQSFAQLKEKLKADGIALPSDEELLREVQEAKEDVLPPEVASLIKMFKANGAQVHVVDLNSGKERTY